MHNSRYILPILTVLFFAVPSHAQQVIPFEGQLDLVRNEYSIEFKFDEESSLAAYAQKVSDDNYRFSIDIEHLQTPLFDLLSKVESSIELIDGNTEKEGFLANPSLKGKIWSQYSLVNYKPIKELNGGFFIKDRRLHLTEFSFGNLNCNGYVDLVQPYEIDMSLDLNGVGMSEFLSFWSTNADYESAGAIFGEIRASGSLDNLMLKGSLESTNGYVQKLNYNTIVLNIEGVYPHMDIADSIVSKSDGVSFSFDGPFDLSDRAQFKKQIKDLKIAPLVHETGSESEWTIKRLNPDESGVTEIKYRLREKDALEVGTSATDRSDMFGFERKREF